VIVANSNTMDMDMMLFDAETSIAPMFSGKLEDTGNISVVLTCILIINTSSSLLFLCFNVIIAVGLAMHWCQYV
jgi:hypothetical protein